MRHFKIELAVCLACSLCLGAGCSDETPSGNGDKADAVESVMKYAPPGVVGVVHVDCRIVAGDVLAELRKRKDQLHGISDEELDRIAAVVAKIDSVNLFFVKGPTEPKVIGIFRTPLAPADVHTVLQRLADEPGTLDKTDNGRYDDTKGGIRIIFGAPRAPPGTLPATIRSATPPARPWSGCSPSSARARP